MGRWAPVEMPVWVCKLVLGVCLIFSQVLGIERVGKPVVFSYSGSDLPHPATISHHYRPPPSTRPQLKPSSQPQYQSPSRDFAAETSGNGPSLELRAHVDEVAPLRNGVAYPSSTLVYFDDRPTENYHHSLPSTEATLAHDDHRRDYDYSTTSSEHYYPYSTVAHFDGRSSDNHHPHPPSSVATPIYDEHQPQDYDYSTISPHYSHPSSTVPYYDDRPLDSDQYYSNPSSAPPLYNDQRQVYDYNVVGHDQNYPSTTVTYYDNPPLGVPYHPSQSPEAPPVYDDHDTDYEYSTNTAPYSEVQYNSRIQEYGSTSSPNDSSFLPESVAGNISAHGVTNSTPHPPVNRYPPVAPSGSHRYSNHPDSGENMEHPNQHPAPPEYPDFSYPQPKGRRTSTSTSNYYDENNDEYVSTTPITEFESVKKLPPIEDYPPPNPGYITRPFKPIFSNQNNIEQIKIVQKAADKSGVSKAYLDSGKVLQQPKYFAYSSDLDGEPVDDGLVHNADGEATAVNDLPDADHDHKKKDEKYSKGGGQEHHSAQKATAGDKGDKGYKSSHKYTKGQKGHHDKEDHKGKYLDEQGKKAKKKEEGGHYGEHHQAEKGKKSAKYGESGEHKKGHSTKGEHNIHKKDEYMKKHEFYDEHHEGGDHEKFGGFMEAHAHKKGGKKKKGHHKSGHAHHQKGKKGHHEKGEKSGHHKGHKDAKGYDGHFSHHKIYGKKGGHKQGKKWGYTKGHPK